jgi:hypothetical protein
MQLIGFDAKSVKIRNTNGRISLVDISGNETASWSFASMLLHWNRKDNQACYVPSLSENENERQYKYGKKIILGTETDFLLFLRQMASGNIYYDLGIKMKNASTKPKKRLVPFSAADPAHKNGAKRRPLLNMEPLIFEWRTGRRIINRKILYYGLGKAFYNT